MAYGGGFRNGGNDRRSGGFRSGGGGFRRNNFNQERTKIKCATCGKEDEVPFKPREGTPVYCRDCFLKSKGITPRENRQEERPRKAKEAEEVEETEESEESMDEAEEDSEDEEEAEEMDEAA